MDRLGEPTEIHKQTVIWKKIKLESKCRKMLFSYIYNTKKTQNKQTNAHFMTHITN